MIESHYFDVGTQLAGNFSPTAYSSDPDDKLREMPVKTEQGEFTIILWGKDNKLPYDIKKDIEHNSVMSQNKLFNTLTCYGRGLEYMDAATMGEKQPKPTQDPDIKKWLLRNAMKLFFAEQIVDLKYYYFSVAVIILNNARNKIVKVIHKDACHCRFEKANKNGDIEHVLYADWNTDTVPEDIEVIPLLNEQDPFGDLAARTGKEKDELGIFKPTPPNQKKFAVVCKMPGVGCHYYPIPPYTASLRDGWYEIYGYLTAAKKAKIKNGQNIRYHVEINTEFWNQLARSQGIKVNTDAFTDMKNKFITSIREYLSGSKNSDKLLWSEFDSGLDGTERHYIKINVVDTSKAGNEYNDDVAEASNVLCYDDNVHPNLAGATPGKSQMNNSGSDKRELFTMKQSLETLYHDVMMSVHNTIIWFNGWQDMVVPVVPMILLTTLDKNTDAKEIDMNNQNGENNGDSNSNN